MEPFTEQEKYAAREMARQDLYFYSRWMFLARRRYRWQQARHHELVCRVLEDVFYGRRRNVIINLPPRYSKTELAIVNFASWALGKVPDAEFIHVSYASKLAVKNSFNTREQVDDAEYQHIFPTRIHPDSRARDDWKTTENGVFYATGSEGTITGFGAGKHRPGFGGAILIDDPHKPDEANSDPVRKGVLDWYQNTLESRRNSPETPIVLIMQRLHENDLAGWLLAGGSGEHFDHVCIPAINEDGTALWPEKHTIEKLREMEAANPYVFAGQYGQRPSPLQGGFFKPDNIEIIDAAPFDVTRQTRGWDFAASENKGDFTAGVKLGVLPDGRTIVLDVVRDRAGPDAVEKLLVTTSNNDGRRTAINYPQDPGQAGKSQALYFGKKLSGHDFTTSTETGDKATRATPFAAQVNVGNVVMVRAPWNDAYKNELRMFPNGTFDDQVDASARAYNHISETRDARARFKALGG